ncbi:MAG: FkbM family methyltransferase [Candidatus Peribacteria bacterium]|jgi:FkbM family methyltransferase|nr:FkbM family methyltransferase [Candidatus Peribacteria bacterium]
MPNYDETLRYEIFVKGEYACAKQAIQQADLIFDIGGHLGYFSERCRSLGSEAEIHYFEPLPFLYEEAKKRLDSDPKISFHNFGIGAKDEEIRFFINEEKSMQSSRYPSFLNKRGKEVKVKIKKLGNIFPNVSRKDGSVNRPNTTETPHILLKLDIEGMEYEVLESRSDDIWNNI